MRKIGIHSVPRSGSTWLGEILNSSVNTNYSFQPLFSHAFKSYLKETSTKKDINLFYDLLYNSNDAFIRQVSQRDEGKLPNFAKNDICTHIVYKEVRYHYLIEYLMKTDSDLFFILLIRDPVSVINSWYNAPREFNPDWHLDEELLYADKKNENLKENYYGLRKWIEVAKYFEFLSKEYKYNTQLITYNDLKKSTSTVVKSLFDRLDLELDEQTMSFITDSTTKSVSGEYSVYRGNKSVNLSLPNDIIKKIRKEVTECGLDHYLNTKVTSGEQ